MTSAVWDVRQHQMVGPCFAGQQVWDTACLSYISLAESRRMLICFPLLTYHWLGVYAVTSGLLDPPFDRNCAVPVTWEGPSWCPSGPKSDNRMTNCSIRLTVFLTLTTGLGHVHDNVFNNVSVLVVLLMAPDKAVGTPSSC